MIKKLILIFVLVLLIVVLLIALNDSQQNHYATLIEFEESVIAYNTLVANQNDMIDEALSQTQVCVENVDSAIGQTQACVENLEILLSRYKEEETEIIIGGIMSVERDQSCVGMGIFGYRIYVESNPPGAFYCVGVPVYAGHNIVMECEKEKSENIFCNVVGISKQRHNWSNCPQCSKLPQSLVGLLNEQFGLSYRAKEDGWELFINGERIKLHCIDEIDWKACE